MASFVGMMAAVVVMLWHSQRAMTKLGVPISGVGRLRSAPFQVSATFCAAIGAGIVVDFLLSLAVRTN
jgi:hypothetical protein